MSDRAGADDLGSQLDAVRAIGLIVAEHAGLVSAADPDAAELIILLCQAGMTFSALFRF
jgi:hypothetical protein